jgi:hypothetical protein
MDNIEKIPQLPIFAPFCIYHMINKEQNEYLGYVGNPTMVMHEDGSAEFKCIPHGTTDPYKGWKLAGKFYAINPLFRPIPSYLSLVCATQVDAFPYNTSDLKHQYDPFHVDNLCINFTTWLEPTPYTTPLHLYSNGTGVFPTFEEHKDLPRAETSVVYVLTNKPMKHTIFPGKKRWFKMVDGVPQFRFRSYQGRCIPDPDGVTLDKCTLVHDLNETKPMSLINYLQKLDAKDRKGMLIPSMFKKSGTWFSLLVFALFLITLLATIWILTKNEKLA